MGETVSGHNKALRAIDRRLTIGAKVSVNQGECGKIVKTARNTVDVRLADGSVYRFGKLAVWPVD